MRSLAMFVSRSIQLRSSCPRSSEVLYQLSSLGISCKPRLSLFVSTLFNETRCNSREWGPAKAREAMLSGRAVTTSELQLLGAIHSTHASLEIATKATHAFAALLLPSAPGAMATCKALVRTADHEGGVGMNREIKSAFLTMMAPSDEAVYGIGQFQKRETVDWLAFAKSRNGGKSKL